MWQTKVKRWGGQPSAQQNGENMWSQLGKRIIGWVNSHAPTLNLTKNFKHT
jgi:hypothetical protein